MTERSYTLDRAPLPKLMLVTDAAAIREPREAERIAAAVAGGVGIVQLRDRAAGEAELLERAQLLRRLVPDTLLIVNQRIDVALAAGADGVHLSGNAMPVGRARHLFGQEALIGRSVHSATAAQAVEADGADYLIVGTIYPTATHPGRVPEGPQLLRAIAATSRAPLYAIGGITAANAGVCVRHGAHGVAVIRAIGEALDPEAAARQLMAAVSRGGESSVIEVTINGDRREVEPGKTLAQFLNGLRLEPQMVVVERNGEIVARDRLAETPLVEGDTLEIVQMMAGG